MTSQDIERLTPLVEGLQKRGVVSTWFTTSWPDRSSGYTHAFYLSARGLNSRILLAAPFTEDEAIRRLALALAHQNHHAAVTSRLMQVGDQLLRNLASVYALQLVGKNAPVPDEVTIKDVHIPLPQSPS